MRVTIHKKNLEITPALAEYIDIKIVKPVEKFLRESKNLELPILEIEIGRSTRHHHKGKVYHAEANLSLGGILIRAEVDDDDARKACDLLKDELLRELVKNKDKKRDVSKREARKAKENLRNQNESR